MFNKIEPRELLNPSTTIIIYLVLSVFLVENHFTEYAILGGVIVGIYIGSLWQSSFYHRDQLIWRFHKPEGWISTKAREAFEKRFKLFRCSIIIAIFNVLGFATLFAFGTFALTLLMKIGTSDFNLWVKIPLAILLVFLSVVVSIAPLLIFQHFSQEIPIYSKAKKELDYYNDFSHEIQLLKEWEARQEKIVEAGKEALLQSSTNAD
jgi:hypothetical protein